MSITYTPVLKKRLSTDNYGIVSIRITKDRKSTYLSIKEKVKDREWNDKNNSVRATNSESERINKLIDDTIIELKQVKDDVVKVVMGTKSKLSLIGYLLGELDDLEKRDKMGSYKRYKTLYYHLERYCKGKLLFADINPKWVRDFQTHLLTQKTTKGTKLTRNTTINYIKCLKRIYNGAIKDELIPAANPFISVSNKKDPVKKKFLKKSEVEQVHRDKMSKGHLLYNTRNYFLFQIFCQGIGVSDLLTFRWSNINKEGRIDFWRFKTKKYQSILINPIITRILIDYMDVDCSKIINTKYKSGDKSLTLADWELEYDKIKKKHISQVIKTGEIPKELEVAKKVLDGVKEKVYALLLIEVIKYSKKMGDTFIFPILKNEDFKNVQFNIDTRLPKYQYNQLQSKEAIYNKNLKKLQTHYKIETTLTSHLQRHTYTNMMLEVTDDIYVVSKSLGHTKLATTEHYISDFVKDKVDAPNTNLFNSF